MNKFIAIMAALVVTLFTINLFAWDPPVSPAPTSWVSDSSNVLTFAAHQRLDAKLKLINQSSANEFAVLLVPTLDGASIEDVGDLTAKAWGVGKKNLDNGVLVVLAMKEHKSRISTGKGVEGDLPDLKCNDILQNARPFLRNGDVEGALGFIVDNSANSIANHKVEAIAQAQAQAQATHPNTNSAPTSIACAVVDGVGINSLDLSSIMVIAIFGLVGFLAYSFDRKRRQAQKEEDALREEEVLREQLHLEQTINNHIDKISHSQREREETLNKITPIVEVPISRPVSKFVSRSTTVRSYSVTPVVSEEKTRERAEEDRRRSEREEDDRRKRRDEESSSSSSGFDWGSSSDSSSSNDSGSFGGGDSGGGGSSSDW